MSSGDGSVSGDPPLEKNDETSDDPKPTPSSLEVPSTVVSPTPSGSSGGGSPTASEAAPKSPRKATLQRSEGSQKLLEKSSSSPRSTGVTPDSPKRKQSMGSKFGSLRVKKVKDKATSSTVIDPVDLSSMEARLSKKEAKKAKKEEKKAKREAKLAEKKRIKEEKKKKKHGGKSEGSLIIGGPSGFQRGHHVEIKEEAVTGVPESWKEEFEKGTGKRTETVSVAPSSAVLVAESAITGKKSSSTRKKSKSKTFSGEQSSGELSSSDWKLKISGPTGPMIRKVHVDADLNWEGEPDEIFDKLKLLGSGAYGSVYLAEHKASGMKFAMKLIPNQGKAKADIMKEIHILKKCAHKNVVQYFGCLYGGSMLYIMMELCGGGSADDVIKHLEEKRIKNEEQVAAIMMECMKGLVYLHSQGIVHRDIKAGNILMTDKGEVKLADFGVSAQFEGEAAAQQTTIGTPLWMAPEVLNGDTYSEKCDIWSIAITAVELADGKPPHAEENLMRAMLLISTGDPPTLRNMEEWSDEFHGFLEHCLIKEPEDRPTAKDLLTDPWLVKAAMAGRAEDKVLAMLASQIDSEEEEGDDAS